MFKLKKQTNDGLITIRPQEIYGRYWSESITTDAHGNWLDWHVKSLPVKIKTAEAALRYLKFFYGDYAVEEVVTNHPDPEAERERERVRKLLRRRSI